MSAAAAVAVRSAEDEARVRAAWRALAAVPDPELPALTLEDLGIVRFVNVREDGTLDVGLSPTYTGCPATDHIAELARRALEDARVGAFSVRPVLTPAWSSDWISALGRRKLEEYGIVPPTPAAGSARTWRPAAAALIVACPRCRSMNTETISEFGSTPCKALHRCRECLEPFERFKCI